MLSEISLWGVLLAAISAMVVGGVWYSPGVFGKEWMKMIGTNEKKMKKRQQSAMALLFFMSLISAYALSLVIVYFHTFSGHDWIVSSIEASLIAGIGFAATSVYAHGAFDERPKELLFINAGNRIVTFFVMGLVLSAFLK